MKACDLFLSESLFAALLEYLGSSEYKSAEWKLKMSLIELLYGDKDA